MFPTIVEDLRAHANEKLRELSRKGMQFRCPCTFSASPGMCNSYDTEMPYKTITLQQYWYSYQCSEKAL